MCRSANVQMCRFWNDFIEDLIRKSLLLCMKYYPALLVLFVLSSCVGNIDQDKRDYIYLRRQLTPDSKHYIYEYSRSGLFVTSNEVSGRRLIKIGESFTENAGKKVDGLIDRWIKDTLVVHIYESNYVQPKDTL